MISLFDKPIQWNIWQFRKELILLTGIVAFSYMGLIMLLATRPKWLEIWFGGLDKMYLLHKWAVILAIGIGGIHYLLKLSGKLIILYVEKPAKNMAEIPIAKSLQANLKKQGYPFTQFHQEYFEMH